MKKVILAIIIVLLIATTVYAASVDEGHAAVRGWYTTEAFASHEAAMAIMRNPVVTDVTAPSITGGSARDRSRHSGNNNRRY